MSEGYRADLNAMDGFAGRLHAAGVPLSSVGDSVPGMPDAGAVSADMAAVVSHLVAVTTELITGVTWAGDLVAAGGADYAEVEDTGRQDFQGGAEQGGAEQA